MHTFLSLPVAGDSLEATPDGGLIVATRNLSFAIDPTTGTSEPTPHRNRAERHRDDDPALVLPARGLRLSHLETDRGPVTRLLDAEGAELATFAGTLASIAIDAAGVFAGSVRLSSQRCELVAGRLGSARVIRLPGGGGAACAGEGFVAVTGAEPYALHVFRAVGDFISRVTIARPGPEGLLGGALVLGASIWVLAGHGLTRVNLAALPRESDRPLPATFFPLVPPARASSETAKVAFALPSGSVGVDHPRFGRIVMTRAGEDPALTRGDEIVLEDVVEELPGVFRVRVWRPRGAPPSHRPPPPALELGAPEVTSFIVDRDALAPLRPEEQQRGGRLDLKLEALAAAHGFTAPNTLVRLLKESEDDDVVKRWLSILGCEPELYFPCEDWEADPFVLSFGGMGNGDAYCLYPYPPALPESREPPIVEFSHETNTSELVAQSFDEFLSSFLANAREDDELRPIVDLLVTRLRLPTPEKRNRPAAPDWLPTYQTDEDLLDRASTLLDDHEPLLAERVLVSLWIGHGSGAERARDRLRGLYADLGWTLPQEAFGSPD